jgi:hypothetical protein
MTPVFLAIAAITAIALHLAGKKRLAELVAEWALKGWLLKGLYPYLKGRSQGRE